MADANDFDGIAVPLPINQPPISNPKAESGRFEACQLLYASFLGLQETT
ncbi:MAG TPA: hypothetical protein VGM43_06905 [Bryobacteraceae bacterium]